MKLLSRIISILFILFVAWIFNQFIFYLLILQTFGDITALEPGFEVSPVPTVFIVVLIGYWLTVFVSLFFLRRRIFAFVDARPGRAVVASLALSLALSALDPSWLRGALRSLAGLGILLLIVLVVVLFVGLLIMRVIDGLFGSSSAGGSVNSRMTSVAHSSARSNPNTVSLDEIQQMSDNGTL